MQDQVGIIRRRRLHFSAFGRSIYQFAKPTTKLGIENFFNAVGTLMHKRMKLLCQQIPFIGGTITSHTFCAQIG
jgi:hypothetical protein